MERVFKNVIWIGYIKWAKKHAVFTPGLVLSNLIHSVWILQMYLQVPAYTHSCPILDPPDYHFDISFHSLASQNVLRICFVLHVPLYLILYAYKGYIFQLKGEKSKIKSSVMCLNNGPKYFLPGMYNFQIFVSQQERKRQRRKEGRKREGRKKIKEINCILGKK